MAVDSLQSLSNLTLCDYFAVIGFDKSTGIQIDKLAELSSDIVVQANGSSDAYMSPLDCSYEAKVLCHFPAYRKGFPFAHEIASLCLPKGLKIYTERKVPKEPNFHSFILVKEDGTRVNGCSLIFYEPLLDAEVRQQIYNMQMEYIRQMAEVDTPTMKTNSQNIEANLNSNSIPRHQSQSQYPPGTISFGDHTLPRKLSSRRSTSGSTVSAVHTSSGESPRRSRQRRHRSHSSQAKKRMSFYDSVSKPIFVSKCICFVTRAPIVYSIENLLRSLWSMVIGKFSYLSTPAMPIESVIYWALHEVPLPLPGTCLQINYGECNLVVRRPSGHELPLFDYPIQILFDFIKIDKFIKLFTCFMLEHQILICSKHMDRLMLIAECLSTLIFPFRWQMTYVPILPYSQLKFTEAPVPYLMGLCYDDKIPEQIFHSNVCIFDIDTGRLDYPEDIPSFPRQREIVAQILQIQLKFCPQLKVQQSAPISNSSINIDNENSFMQKGDSDVVLRRNAPKSVKNSEDNKDGRNHSHETWTMKRMSRSFDDAMSFSDAAKISDAFCVSQRSEDENDSNNNDERHCGVKLTNLVNDFCGENFNNGSRQINGVSVDGKTLDTVSVSTDKPTTLQKHVESYNAYLRGLKFNRAIRELFVCNFASLFASYEHFLIGATNGGEERENRESIVNFDKVSFLSDQPESYLPFLAAFLETQMFTSFVDAKILSHCHTHSEDMRYVSYFDRKISHLISIVSNDVHLQNAAQSTTQQSSLNNYHQNRTPVMERPLDFLFMSPSFLSYQNDNMDADLAISADYEVESPHLLSVFTNSSKTTNALSSTIVAQSFSNGKNGDQFEGSRQFIPTPSEMFPELNAENFEVLAKFGSGMDGSVASSPWKQQHRKQRILNVLEDAASRLTPSGKNPQNNNEKSVVESPMKLAQQNKKFVDQLLKETKTKTKRLLVAKMGKEAVHLGHGDLGITGVEENTLVAGLCDLLERIWSHGLKKKQGKSALWSHIYAHYDREKLENSKSPDRYSNLSPGCTVVGGLKNGKFCDAVENVNYEEDTGENAKTLNDLLVSIRTIAKSIELMPFDDATTKIDEGKSIIMQKQNLSDEESISSSFKDSKAHETEENFQAENNTELEKLINKNQPPHYKHQIRMQSLSDTNNNNEKIINSKWQSSLFKAANFIYNKIDKISAVDIPPRSAASKSLTLNPTNNNEQAETNDMANSSNASKFDENSYPATVRRGRSTEKRSTANSEESDASREARATRDESKPRFYHHDDEYSKRLRHASRQRRAEAAAAAMAATKMGGGVEGRRRASEGKKSRPSLTSCISDDVKFQSKPTIALSDSIAIQQENLLRPLQSVSVAPSIEEILRLARTKLADVTAGSAFNSSGRFAEKQQRFMDSDRIPSALQKSSSISDFTPHWSGKESFSETNEDEGNAKMTPGETQTLGRSTKRQFSQQRDLFRKRSASRTRGSGFPHRGSEPSNAVSDFEFDERLPPLPTHMTYDLRNVMCMTEIKTDIGFARAFVRLALERKLLHKHLKAVLSDSHLLQKMYKRYAFLRCEEEREQFLYHILSLNAVDFSCFTHTFISTKIRYEVTLVASIDRFSSSSIWIMLAGSLGSTSHIYLPSNSLQFKFYFKNLGVLSTLRIGHSAGEKGAYPSKWYLDYVLVRNNVTAQTYSFNCGRWFGRGVDDGALERLLVAENFRSNFDAAMMSEAESGAFISGSGSNFTTNASAGNGGGTLTSAAFAFALNNFMSRPESPVSGGGENDLLVGGGTLPHQKSNQRFHYSTGSLARRRRSPSVTRSNDYYGVIGGGNTKQTTPKITELQHKLGMAVNALVKHFFTEKDYRTNARLTLLLCGENGLVPYVEQVFEMGRQDSLFSNRFFRQSYPWDYIERVFAWFANFFRNGESRKLTREQRSLIIYAYNLVVKISSNNAVGKEGKFHVFILLTLRDHILSGLLPLMAWTPVTVQIYEESAFIRQSQHLTYLSKLLSSLNEFNFTLEKSLIYGIEL